MRTRNAALKWLIFTWLLATLITTVNFVVPKSFKSRYGYITTSITGIALPFVFTVVCYILVFVAIRKRNEHFAHIASNSNIINEKRILKMILCVLAVYILCWLPFAIVNGMTMHLLSLLGEAQVAYIGYSVKFLQYMNSTCNQFVYAI